MSGIVLELQSDALDINVDIATLLRKAFLVARKLKLSEFEEWVNHEINGYQNHSECPDYREVRGELKSWNPYHGWMPVLIDAPELYNFISYRKVPNSIASIVHLLKSGNSPSMPIPSGVLAKIANITDVEANYAIFFSKNSFEAIIESVRTKILDWSMVLEENGITGDGLSFSDREKEIATNTPQVVNYTNVFYKDAENVQIQQGTEGSRQNKED